VTESPNLADRSVDNSRRRVDNVVANNWADFLTGGCAMFAKSSSRVLSAAACARPLKPLWVVLMAGLAAISAFSCRKSERGFTGTSRVEKAASGKVFPVVGKGPSEQDTPARAQPSTTVLDRHTIKAMIAQSNKTPSPGGPEVKDVVAMGPPVVEPLIACLKDTDEGTLAREAAACALGKLGDKQAVEPLIVCLQDSDERVRYVALDTLGELGDDRALEPLIACLRHNDCTMRGKSAHALVKMGHPEPAVESLATCLKDTDCEVRRDAVSALGAMGGTPLVRACEMNA
jgi:hypothetical protein